MQKLREKELIVCQDSRKKAGCGPAKDKYILLWVFTTTSGQVSGPAALLSNCADLAPHYPPRSSTPPCDFKDCEEGRQRLRNRSTGSCRTKMDGRTRSEIQSNNVSNTYQQALGFICQFLFINHGWYRFSNSINGEGLSNCIIVLDFIEISIYK